MAARSFAGVPYRHMGRTRGGLDCAGLVAASLREVGCTIYDVRGYGSRPELRALLAGLGSNLQAVDQPMDGDVLAFALRGAHCGVVDGHGFWHVLKDRTVMWTPLRGVWRRSHTATYGVG